MNRNVSLVLSIIRDAKLPAVRQLADELPGVEHQEKWGEPGTVGLVLVDYADLDALGDACNWIERHADIHLVDAGPLDYDKGKAQLLVVRIRDTRAAVSRRNALELRAKILHRRTEAHRDLSGSMPAAMNVDYHLGKIIQWEAERDCWQRIADRPQEFRAVFSGAVVDLITGLGTSADSLEDAVRFRQLTGLRSFVRRARVYMDAEDAVDALLSF